MLRLVFVPFHGSEARWTKCEDGPYNEQQGEENYIISQIGVLSAAESYDGTHDFDGWQR